ncbi:hypothetical protein B0920_20725 [Massilia sp. KIM]|uniref:DUF3016 domain-containing protein n=1 Tax=Massilia sp. KIM TaxID=1955422 RepID=UPI00098EFA51|nr:DUF3016 domain-containing protein [Massilia sp. KIM]OON59711.1 hypothetical protein B0920_20725 [Massilia sp. KIM]
MRSSIAKLALAGLLAFGAGTASAGVTVNYIESERFSDLPFAPWEREEVLKNLNDYFTKLGANLPQGQDLTIDVTDIDLAGREYPTRGSGRDLRVLKGMADWPIITLRYSLTQDGQVLRSGDAKLADMSYLQRINRWSDSDTLRYEKRMIQEWFDQAILQKRRS